MFQLLIQHAATFSSQTLIMNSAAKIHTPARTQPELSYTLQPVPNRLQKLHFIIEPLPVTETNKMQDFKSRAGSSETIRLRVPM